MALKNVLVFVTSPSCCSALKLQEVEVDGGGSANLSG